YKKGAMIERGAFSIALRPWTPPRKFFCNLFSFAVTYTPGGRTMQIQVAFFLNLLLGSILAMTPNHNLAKTTSSGDVTNQINKTITLAPGSNVKVHIVSGDINIETWDSDRGEINITVKASDTAAMERQPIIVEDTPNSLTIRVEDDKEGNRRGR